MVNGRFHLVFWNVRKSDSLSMPGLHLNFVPQHHTQPADCSINDCGEFELRDCIPSLDLPFFRRLTGTLMNEDSTLAHWLRPKPPMKTAKVIRDETRR